MADLLHVDELPAGFEYPADFVRVVELGLTQLEPWQIIDGELLRVRFHGIVDRYPTRRLVPFSRRIDNDDLACWDIARGIVVVIHDFASPGTEVRAEYGSFYDWLRSAIEDLIEYDD